MLMLNKRNPNGTTTRDCSIIKLAKTEKFDKYSVGEAMRKQALP